MKFEQDERFADIEYRPVPFTKKPKTINIHVSHDPADSAACLILSDVVAYEIVNSGKQNIVSHIEYSRSANTELDEFISLVRKESAASSFDLAPLLHTSYLCIILIAANGADVFVICRSIEKKTAQGTVLYGIYV